MNALLKSIKIIKQLGVEPVLQVGLYRFGLLTGHYRRSTPQTSFSDLRTSETEWMKCKTPISGSRVANYLQSSPQLIEECRSCAEEILAGTCVIFGRTKVDIFQKDPDTFTHWTDYETGKIHPPVEDIKFLWEPARLGWLFSICRLAAAGVDESLGLRAWNLLEEFFRKNPVNTGPNWMNGQEVALRIFALVFFHEVFSDNSEMPSGWEEKLAGIVIDHARRILPTLVYARSQQNNHLLVEAAGLYTAGVFIPDLPEAEKWRTTGWKLFHQGLEEQINDGGMYAQYSVNYHRLMLQTSLWMKAVSRRNEDIFPPISNRKLAAATNWLSELVMPENGRAPNYGHNDGAYIIPLTGKPYEDFRPVTKAAVHFFSPGKVDEPVDEMSLWFEWLSGGQVEQAELIDPVAAVQSYRKINSGKSVGLVFSPLVTKRPGQADLLHSEIWYNGEPILLDAGTYRYNAAPPWRNGLAGTAVHNTVSINGSDQMTRAGRFLWLDWPKTWWIEEGASHSYIAAGHDGYKNFKVLHERFMSSEDEKKWLIQDEIISESPGSVEPVQACIHWLLPLNEWKVSSKGLVCTSHGSKKSINVYLKSDKTFVTVERQVIKAGELIYNNTGMSLESQKIATLGWYSPTYGYKEPAVSYRVIISGKPPFSIVTEIHI